MEKREAATLRYVLSRCRPRGTTQKRESDDGSGKLRASPLTFPARVDVNTTVMAALRMSAPMMAKTPMVAPKRARVTARAAIAAPASSGAVSFGARKMAMAGAKLESRVAPTAAGRRSLVV